MRYARWSLLLLFLSACVSPQQHADDLARPAKMIRREVKGGAFVLTTYARLTDETKPTAVYIEGDGLAWITETTPSPDPTPQEALGLALASLDPSSNVIYMARPCQYTAFSRSPRCETDYWTDKRFAQEVIDSMDAALAKLLAQRQNKDIHLVGYSGGGAVAVLMAAQRSGVLSIRTVAGNLDHDTFARIHDVSPMPQSRNAIDVAKKVAVIPQRHFVGGDDDVVPAAILYKYRDAASSPCVKVDVLSGATHENGWKERWPALLKKTVSCAKEK